MRVFIKHNKELERVTHKRVAPLSARKEIQDNIRQQTANANNTSLQDRGLALKEVKKWKKTLENNCPETLSVEAKNAMWKRAKQLKDEFSVGMLSTDELHPVSTQEKNGVISVLVNRDKMGSINSVKREIAWKNKNESKVREYKNLMRHLTPQNPSATDINKFRPIGRIK